MNQAAQFRLKPCTDQQLVGVFRWFNSSKAVHYWAGPDVTYPLQIKRFKQESKFNQNHSFVLLNELEQVVGFGQFYQRLDRCHLGRLVVSPSHRKQGLGKVLVTQLLAQGQRQLDLAEASLFVLSDNVPALKLYRQLGFVETPYPKTIPLAKCIYMVRPENPD